MKFKVRSSKFEGGRVFGAGLLVMALVLQAATFAQQRDNTAAPTGTGEISGVVMSADQQPVPIRRVVVSLAGDSLPVRSVMTDDAGRFAFGRLPAGSFSITARKAAYLATEFGSTAPGRAGSRVALAAAEKRAIALTMFKGAVLAGTIRDGAGQPLAGIPVGAIDVRIVSQNLSIAPESAVTDDRGSYRIYGVMPGEYVVQAAPSASGTGEIGARAQQETDALLASLTQRQNRASNPAAVPPPLPPATPVAYSPIYFPGTPLYPEAARVRVAAGEEREGLNFEVGLVPAATIEGTVGGDVANPASVQLSITPDGPRVSMGTAGITSSPPDAKGEFRYGNLPPGRYRIVARARRGATDPASVLGSTVSTTQTGGTAGSGGGPPPPGMNMATSGELVYAAVDVDVRGRDVKGLTLLLQNGGTFSGKLVFDAEKAEIPDDVTTFRVSASLVGGSYFSQTGSTRVGTALAAVPPTNVTDDGSFRIVGLGPAEYTVTTQIPAYLSSVWKLRSAIVDGRDLLDTHIDGPANLDNVVVTLTDKRTEIAGTLASASGQPASEYYVILFPADRSLWRFGARRNLSARPATDGRFVLADPPPGDYLMAALTDLDPAAWQDPSFLEQVAPAAIKVSIKEGEKKVQNLRIK